MTSNEYTAQLCGKMEICYNLARKHLKETAQRQKRDSDTRICQRKYKPGGLVYKQNPINKKLETPWLGPYVVVKPVGDSIYLVKDKRKIYVLHYDRLKPYTSREVPTWAAAHAERLSSN